MAKQGIGASVPRNEDDRFLRGKARFVGDIALPGMREIAFVRSPVAHARLRAIEVPPAWRSAVFTAADLAAVRRLDSAPPLPGFQAASEPVLAHQILRFVGEPVAMCVGSTRGEAEDIAAAVRLEYDELPAVVDMLAARAADSPRVHDHWRDNVVIEVVEDRWREAIVQKAPIVVHQRIRTSRQCSFPLEGAGVVAWWDAQRRMLTIATSTQVPHTVQTGLAACLGLDDGTIRVIAPDVGGGFGYKCVVRREEIALAWLALRTREPLRWLEDCRERLIGSANCREHDYDLIGYATAEGRLLGLDCVVHVDAGAYSTYPMSASIEALQIANLLPGPYDLASYRCRSAAMATNKPPIMAYRGVGRTGACLAIESVLEAVAREARIEPFEVRLRSLVRAEQMPFDNITGKHFDSGDYPACLQRAVEAIGVARVRERQRQGGHDGLRVGVGVAFFCEQGAHGTTVVAPWGRPVVPGYEQAHLRLTADAHLEIRVGTHSHGQGHETTYAQIAHEVLGVDVAQVRVLQGDTLYTPYSTGTWGSRSIVLAGGAVAGAARVLAQRATAIGAHLLGCDVASTRFERGTVRALDDRWVSLRDIAQAWYLAPQKLPRTLDATGLEATAGYRPARDSGTFSYAAHAAVVLVDTATGNVDVEDYVVVEDGGVLVNPMIVDGQVRGGTTQGIGTALWETMRYDAQGQPLASTLLDYMLPGAVEVPPIRVVHMTTPSPYTDAGAKGLGEGGAVGPPAAIVAAVNDALHGLAAVVVDLPLTPERILRALAEASSTQLANSSSTASLRTASPCSNE